jgi:acyl-CoA thioesterase FadM
LTAGDRPGRLDERGDVDTDERPSGQPRPFVHLMAAPDEGHDGGFHVSNQGIAQIFFEARNRYFDRLPVDWHDRVIPMIRELLIRFQGEVNAGTPVRCTICAVERAAKVLVVEEAAFDVSDPAAPRPIASARSVHVTVDTEAGGAVDVPDALIELIEALQGAPLPRAEPSPRH